MGRRQFLGRETSVELEQDTARAGHFPLGDSSNATGCPPGSREVWSGIPELSELAWPYPSALIPASPWGAERVPFPSRRLGGGSGQFEPMLTGPLIGLPRLLSPECSGVRPPMDAITNPSFHTLPTLLLLRLTPPLPIYLPTHSLTSYPRPSNHLTTSYFR